MPALECNVRGIGQYMTVQNSEDGLHPETGFTIEALLTPLGVGEDPTIVSRPAGTKWEPPFVAYRLGFYATSLIPEFQLLLDGESTPVTVRGTKPAILHQLVHLAGTYDGTRVRLLVDGEVVEEFEKIGTGVRSPEPPTVGSRSTSDPGGYFVGLLHEVRAWNVARTADEIDFWKYRTLPLPTPGECQGLWRTEVGIGREQAIELRNKGFSDREVAWASFITGYVSEFNRVAPEVLSTQTRSRFSDAIAFCLLIKAKDGYLVIYSRAMPVDEHSMTAEAANRPLSPFLILDQSEATLSALLQHNTRNVVKVVYPTLGSRADELWAEPEDLPNPEGSMLASEFTQSRMELPRISVAPGVIVQDEVVVGVRSGRLRLVSPLMVRADGSVSRLFDCIFIDLWFGEINWDVAVIGLAEALTMTDLITLDQVAQQLLAPGELISVRPTNQMAAAEAIIDEFEKLLNRPGVQEVKDIQPFLADPKRWFLLSPSCEHVWPQKMLGSKYKVDYLVKEADGTYVAIEIESPNKKMYKSGREVDPYSDFSHAEQQVRDYCNYIDWNRDSVEREEGLAGIFRPRGVVVIGRRRDLSSEGAKKLKERNADSGRYTVMVYDDLIDRARHTIDRLKAL